MALSRQNLQLYKKWALKDFVPYPEIDPSKIEPGATVTIFFPGASTGYGDNNSRVKTVQDWGNKNKQIVQPFRWFDYKKALQWQKRLPKDVKLRLLGYSNGAQAANRLAYATNSPVSLVAPIKPGYKDYVPWAVSYQPSNRDPLRGVTDFVVSLGGRAPLESWGSRLKRFKGTHHQGVNEALLQALNKPYEKPTEEQLATSLPPIMLNYLYPAFKLSAGGLSGALGWHLADRYISKKLPVKLASSLTLGTLGYIYSQGLLDKLLQNIKKWRT